MALTKFVEHKAIITNIREGLITVDLTQHSACSSCHAKEFCTLSESVTKTIEIIDTDGNHTVGEEVIVVLEESLAFKALFLGYLLPFFIVVFSIFVTSFFTANEIIIGLFSVWLLIPYYFMLHKFRNNIEKTFIFRIKDN